ncbi:Heterokaryon incompatibility protein [Rutstroemia sp. NJR-2017a BBW]|nr:Heterokaryon incompatibility protein [Rutstroemia sp. NJR-2017a BBW]
MEMFSFPYPQDTHVEPIRVPLVARIQYSITGIESNFSGFFMRAVDAEEEKINVSVFDETGSTRSVVGDFLASTTQAWLFFGLASEALGRNVKHEEFADVGPGETLPCIDVRIPLWFWRELKDRWDELYASLTAAEFEDKRARLGSIYDSALLRAIDMDSKAHMLDYRNLTQVLLSSTGGEQGDQRQGNNKAAQGENGRKWVVQEEAKLTGYISMLYPALYFLSSLKPRRIKEEDHSSCSSESCLVTSQLSMPRHRTDECVCEDVAVPVDRVNAIDYRSPSGKTELEVVPYTPSSKFIAISHVWANQQFGSAQNCLPKCQVGYLEEIILSLPTSMADWRLREWIGYFWSSQSGEIAPPSHAYEYFWLDTFCIPQAAEHAGLRNKAIESMNLIYAAAYYTLVFDKGLQTLDAGRRPASLSYLGRPTYYAPQNSLDTVAYIFASNWMGRAWTLQEGILSGNIVFPLHGSLAYTKLLRPDHDSSDDGFGGLWELTVNSIPKDFRESIRDSLPRKIKTKIKVNMRLEDESTEPFREVVQRQLFEHMKNALNVEEYRNYARTPSLPAELLFSECARLGTCAVDSWIPREIVHEIFEGTHTLKLDPAGFTFETKRGSQALKFYLLSSAQRSDRFQILLPNLKDAKGPKYNVEALQKSNDEQHAAPTSVWCIVVDTEPAGRGARFVVNRVVGSKYFLHFDCPLRLTKIDDSKSPSDSEQEPKHEIGAVRLTGNFILERSHDPQDLSISRPQNPEQYSDRLMVIDQAVHIAWTFEEQCLIRMLWGDDTYMRSKLFYICYLFYSYKRSRWFEKALIRFVHRAWIGALMDIGSGFGSCPTGCRRSISVR